MKIKEKVLKEVRNSGWSPELDVGMSYVEQGIDLAIAETQREQLEGFIQYLEEKSKGSIHVGTDVRLHHALMLYRSKVKEKTLAEVEKVIKDYKKDMKVLKGDTELTFEEHINNIKQKLGI